MIVIRVVHHALHSVCLPALPCSQGMLYLETSAKTGARVHDLFEALARRMAGGLPVSSHALQPTA